MKNFRPIILTILRLVIGVVFMVSSLSKALDTGAFTATIVSYGFEFFKGLAPVIIVVEFFVSILLILKIRIKEVSLLSLIMLIVFTSLYSYAYFFRDVKDCGCFGDIKQLNLTPVQFYIRNSILFAGSLLLFLYDRNKEVEIAFWKKGLIAVCLLCMSYLTGFTHKIPIKLFNKVSIPMLVNKQYDYDFEGKHIDDTPLGDIITTNRDSSYLFFCFSYTCPHCWNSMENIKQYSKSNYVDKTFLLGTGNKDSQRQFVENFSLEDTLINVPYSTMIELTNLYPTSYFVKNDTITQKYSGALPVYQLLLKTN